ncbi:hypothetical protein LTR37_017314 [Vermiconidia calcicola]|uniref:Uncharacterized protein n=1 Tax=Vermiconidia calcicola TaxID=1690605 RepID=A0ACC3MN74_9PEZI|nr:hypothetical protein LTR37_017314 [Vermiconidia calcicola]
MDYFFRTLDVMAEFPNTLGALAAYKAVIGGITEACTPVIAAVVRDLKKYMKLKYEATGQRILPIGYCAATTHPRDKMILDYLSSQTEAERIDFWTCEGYSWASPADMESSGYNRLIERYESTTIPFFFSEYGNTPNLPRLFDETIALYSPQMTRVFSGGFVYKFWHGANPYGLVGTLPAREEGVTPGEVQQPDRRDAYVAETRQTAQGTLRIFQDFMNYKASLEATKDIQPNNDRAVTHALNSDLVESSGLAHVFVNRCSITPREDLVEETPAYVGQVPESCVDWVKIEDNLEEWLLI